MHGDSANEGQQTKAPTLEPLQSRVTTRGDNSGVKACSCLWPAGSNVAGEAIHAAYLLQDHHSARAARGGQQLRQAAHRAQPLIRAPGLLQGSAAPAGTAPSPPRPAR